jgi:hypothetical protein
MEAGRPMLECTCCGFNILTQSGLCESNRKGTNFACYHASAGSIFGQPPEWLIASARGVRQASVRRPAGSARDRVGRPVPGRSDGSALMSQSVAMRERRAALHLARLEPGVGYWLAKQRWLWRQNRCDPVPCVCQCATVDCALRRHAAGAPDCHPQGHGLSEAASCNSWVLTYVCLRL